MVKSYISAWQRIGSFYQVCMYVNLPSMENVLQNRHSWAILCNAGEVYIYKHGLYISALQYVRMLLSSNYVLLVSMNISYEYCHAWVIRWNVCQVSIFGAWVL